MKKQIIVYGPQDCPYHNIMTNRGKVTRRWCSFSGYGRCFKTKFPKDCPLDDLEEDKK